MLAAIITPMDCAYFMGLSRYQLVLPQFLTDKESMYRKHVEANILRGDWTILDNGAAEAESFDFAALVDLAIELKVSEVVAPDVLGNYEATKALSGSFITSYWETLDEHNIKIMGVPQADNWEDWFNAWHWFYDNHRVSSIGVPKLVDKIGPSRVVFIEVIARMLEKRIEIQIAKHHHLLGQSQWLGEIAYVAKYHPWIRGIDSAYPLALARQGKLYYPQGIRDSSVGSIVKESGPSFDRATATANVTRYLRVCQAPSS